MLMTVVLGYPTMTLKNNPINYFIYFWFLDTNWFRNIVSTQVRWLQYKLNLIFSFIYRSKAVTQKKISKILEDIILFCSIYVVYKKKNLETIYQKKVY